MVRKNTDTDADTDFKQVASAVAAQTALGLCRSKKYYPYTVAYVYYFRAYKRQWGGRQIIR